MKTRDGVRIVKGAGVVIEKATLFAATWPTVNLHCNVLHELLCSRECAKCVCTSVVETDIGFCVVVL
jgi:hypothetical protein